MYNGFRRFRCFRVLDLASGKFLKIYANFESFTPLSYEVVSYNEACVSFDFSGYTVPVQNGLIKPQALK